MGFIEELVPKNRERGNVCGIGRQILEMLPALWTEERTSPQLAVQEKLSGMSPSVFKVEDRAQMEAKQ